MPGPARPLAVSPSERMILEAFAASEEIPESVKKRARVVLMAADGAANCTIGREVSFGRPRVLFWRQRFSEQGIRGLWAIESVPPRERVSEQIERAIVFDCLNGPRLTGALYREMLWDPSLNWNVRNLARRHGVSPATVQRIWKKYGIHLDRAYKLDRGVFLDNLKVSRDPLFGLTVYEIGGLFYENIGPVIALCSRERPFSELALSPMSVEARRGAIADLVARLRGLESRSFGRPESAAEEFVDFVKRLQAKPRHAGAQIHLLAHYQDTGAYISAAAQTYIAGQACIQLHYTPWNCRGRRWSNLVERWLQVIADWPMQTSFLTSAFQTGNLLRQVPRDRFRGALIIG